MMDNFSTNRPFSCGEESIETSPRSKILYGLLLLVICVGACFASPSIKGEIAQPSGTANATDHVKHAPSITATPDRVTVGVEPGRSEVRWDTGDGSIGFVYVSANGGKRTLFAMGSTGSKTAPWIQPANYLFELYRDAEQRTLLSAVTVSGIAPPEISPKASPKVSLLAALWQSNARWLLVAVVAMVLYFAVYFSAPGAIPRGFPAEPTTSPRQLHVARNLLLGVAVFACLDGAIFHTGLYTSVLAPDSFAGRMAILTRAEKERVSSGLKEVLVLGDSRMAEGFSAVAADKLGSTAGLKFLSVAEPASSIEIWHYMLRDVDPTTHRYFAIVIPYGYGYQQSRGQLLKVAMAAPLLRYSDCFNFSTAFPGWSDRFRAFTACILRGSAFQTDVVDLLEHPIIRAKSVQLGPKRLLAKAVYKGRDADIVGTVYDPKTGQVTFPPRLTEAERDAIRYSLVPPSALETQHLLELQRQWIQRILERYSGSPTEIILMPTPRGPFGGFSGLSMAYHTFFGGIPTNKSIFSLSEHTFDFLEAPEYYFDGYHLNMKGRQKFTEAMVAELLRRLQSANSPQFTSDPEYLLTSHR
jgi:hypothetical protein